MNAMLKKYLKTLFSTAMTFVLLTGMSATVYAEDFTTTPLDPKGWEEVETSVMPSDLPGFKAITPAEAIKWKEAPQSGNTALIYDYREGILPAAIYKNGIYQNSTPLPNIKGLFGK